jgi:hypothetical protein
MHAAKQEKMHNIMHLALKQSGPMQGPALKAGISMGTQMRPNGQERYKAMHQKAFNRPKTKFNDAGSFIDPLTSVRVVSELLRDYPDLEDNQRRRLIDLILISTDRMILMVEQMA